jgi:hypothetical protein
LRCSPPKSGRYLPSIANAPPDRNRPPRCGSASIFILLKVCTFLARTKHIGGCAHALGHGALQIGMHCAVFFADDVPARLRLPSGSTDFRREQVGLGNALSRPNELLPLLRKVSAEILRALRTPSDTSIYDFDVGEDVGPRELGLLRLRRFIGVRSERADIFH